MERTITIEGKEITFKATARTPLLYKQTTGKDLFVGFQKAQKDQGVMLEIVSELAYVMAKQADPELPGMDEWFDSFDMFSLYMALPELTDLWQTELQTSVPSKKKANRRKGS